jgi:hypothetical protein
LRQGQLFHYAAHDKAITRRVMPVLH